MGKAYQEQPGFFTRRELTSSEAWRTMRPLAKVLLTVLQGMYRGVSTNGNLRTTERQLADMAGVSNRTSLRQAMEELMVRGFVIQTLKAEQTAKVEDRGFTAYEVTCYPRPDPKWSGKGSGTPPLIKARDLWRQWQPDVVVNEPRGDGWVRVEGGEPRWTFDCRTLPIDRSKPVALLAKTKRDPVKRTPKADPAPRAAKPVNNPDPETMADLEPIELADDVPY